MKQPIQQFLLALTFFSRIPLPSRWFSQTDAPAKLSDTVVFFPIVGIVIAIVPAIVWFVSIYALPSGIAAALSLVSALIITGALHEDGFADCADGFGATHDRDKALEIMRDSRIGTYGTLALISSVLLRWGALTSLGPISGLFAIVISHSGSRSAILIAMKFSQYARAKGLGDLANGEFSDTDFVVGMGIPCLLGLLLGWLAGLGAVILGMLAGWIVLKYLQHRLGGYTGDGLGTIQQISEITIMIALAGFWS